MCVCVKEREMEMLGVFRSVVLFYFYYLLSLCPRVLIYWNVVDSERLFGWDGAIIWGSHAG